MGASSGKLRMRSATSRIRAADDSDDPPNFITTVNPATVPAPSAASPFSRVAAVAVCRCWHYSEEPVVAAADLRGRDWWRSAGRRGEARRHTRHTEARGRQHELTSTLVPNRERERFVAEVGCVRRESMGEVKPSPPWHPLLIASSTCPALVVAQPTSLAFPRPRRSLCLSGARPQPPTPPTSVPPRASFNPCCFRPQPPRLPRPDRRHGR